MPFVVLDPSHVQVDGVSAGSVVDVLSNHAARPEARRELLAALRGWHETLQQSHAAQVKEAGDRHAEIVSRLAAGHAADAASSAATIAGLQAQVAALGGTELARRLGRDARRHAAVKAIADAQAALDTLDAADAEAEAEATPS
jgi:hypothetical protein